MNYNLWELYIQSVNTASVNSVAGFQFQCEQSASVAVAMADAAVQVVSIIIRARCV